MQTRAQGTHAARRERKGRKAPKWRLGERERGRGEESGTQPVLCNSRTRSATCKYRFHFKMNPLARSPGFLTLLLAGALGSAPSGVRTRLFFPSSLRTLPPRTQISAPRSSPRT